MMDYVIKTGNLYFEKWGRWAGYKTPIWTNIPSAAHRTDKEAAEMIAAMVYYANFAAVIEPINANTPANRGAAGRPA